MRNRVTTARKGETPEDIEKRLPSAGYSCAVGMLCSHCFSYSELVEGDEIETTEHSYAACDNCGGGL